MAQYTAKLTLNASITFDVNEGDDATKRLEEIIFRTQRLIDRRGDDEHGIYFTIDAFGEPEIVE